MSINVASAFRRHPLILALSGILLLFLAWQGLTIAFPQSEKQCFAEWEGLFMRNRPGFTVIGKKRSKDWFLLAGKSEGGDTIAACAWYRGDCPRALANGEYHYRIRIDNPSTDKSLISIGDFGVFSAPAFKRHPLSGASLMGDMRIASIEPRYSGGIAIKAGLVVAEHVRPQPTDLPSELMVVQW